MPHKLILSVATKKGRNTVRRCVTVSSVMCLRSQVGQVLKTEKEKQHREIRCFYPFFKSLDLRMPMESHTSITFSAV